MSRSRGGAAPGGMRGFTLVELLVTLTIVALMAVAAYRALGSVLDAGQKVQAEVDKWNRISGFFERFERDVRMAAPRTVRQGELISVAWSGRTGGGSALEFSRFGNGPGDPPRRVAYRLNELGEIELLMWAKPDAAPGMVPVRHALLSGVTGFELRYFNAVAGWVDSWPGSTLDAPIPRAVRLRISLAGNEEVVRVFELRS